jgi:FkbM family methyltransferase
MKPKEILYLLGLKSSPKHYGLEIKAFDLKNDGRIQYAQWLHPRERSKIITQESVDELRKFLSEGDVAIDIGAHTGDSTIPIALAVGKEGVVFAIEPNSYVFPTLKKNSEINSEKTNIIPLLFASTPEDGEYIFEYSDAGFCNGGFHEGISKWKHGHAFQLKVEGKNLHKFLELHYSELIPKVRFIKVDAEGYDHTILESLSDLIRRVKPFIKAEVFKRTNGDQRLRFYEFLASFGYSIFHVESDTNLKGEPIKQDDLMRWAHYDIFCVPLQH